MFKSKCLDKEGKRLKQFDTSIYFFIYTNVHTANISTKEQRLILVNKLPMTPINLLKDIEKNE